jgi:4-hydroxy-tetrahydrodipicolinate reductase
MGYRVVHWGTGNTGRLALRGIIQHPDLELVGLHVHSAAKVGLDAGELAGLPPTGILATDDPNAIAGLGADCLAYLGDGIGRTGEAVADMCQFLSAGINVVTTSLNDLVYPPSAPANLRDPLVRACEAGGTTFFNNGADPGFGTDLIPLVLLTLMDDVRSVRVQEIVNYSYYDQAYVMRELFGFGQPPGHAAPMFTMGWLTDSWGGVINQIADRLGVTLDSIDETHDIATLDRDVETAVGTIEAGTAAGIRFEVRGIVGGEPVIVVEHDTRIHADAAPDWPRCHNSENGYRILIEGSPDVVCELNLTDERGGDGGLIATAMRVVNAIPAVCDAKPGLLDTTDLPFTISRNVRF